jgi:hypothetical protein
MNSISTVITVKNAYDAKKMSVLVGWLYSLPYILDKILEGKFKEKMFYTFKAQIHKCATKWQCSMKLLLVVKSS